MAMAAAANICLPTCTRACNAWASTMLISSITIARIRITPLEETMSALALMVRQGKALYVGLSNYPAPLVSQAAAILADIWARRA